MSKLIRKFDPATQEYVLGKINPDELSPGLADANYIHYQDVPSSTWVIVHNLGKKPSVDIVDSAGTKVEGEINYLDNNRVEVKFTAEFSGKAICN